MRVFGTVFEVGSVALALVGPAAEYVQEIVEVDVAVTVAVALGATVAVVAQHDQKVVEVGAFVEVDVTVERRHAGAAVERYRVGVGRSALDHRVELRAREDPPTGRASPRCTAPAPRLCQARPQR